MLRAIPVENNVTQRSPSRSPRIDLNLMVAFDALMAERNLTRAADRLGLSQPGLSHVLRRLRALTGDALFVRKGRTLEPTAYALRLATSVSSGLALIARGLDRDPTFDPATENKTLTLTLSDLGALALLPKLVPLLRAEAPGIDIEVIAVDDAQGLGHVQSGEADIGLGVYPTLPPGVSCQVVVTPELVCYADARHPALTNGLTLEAFLALPHVAVSVGRGQGADAESLLNAFGLQRRVMLTVPHFLLAPTVLEGSDLLAVLPAGVIAPEPSGLKAFPLPVRLPGVAVRMIWLQRRDHDPTCVWLRNVISAALAQALEGQEVAEGPDW